MADVFSYILETIQISSFFFLHKRIKLVDLYNALVCYIHRSGYKGMRMKTFWKNNKMIDRCQAKDRNSARFFLCRKILRKDDRRHAIEKSIRKRKF